MLKEDFASGSDAVTGRAWMYCCAVTLWAVMQAMTICTMLDSRIRTGNCTGRP
jgi:hypothetical protein